MIDTFDPNTWEPAATCRLPLQDHDDGPCVLLDPEDYAWFSQWRWTANPSNTRQGRRPKLYATRTLCRRYDGRATYTKIFLHKEVLIRAVGYGRPGWHIGDHKNGNSLDCRRANLRWATPRMNRRNIHGSYTEEMDV